MTYSVYVLKSLSTKKFYIGQTANLQKRLREHNDPECFSTLYTKQNLGPWHLIYKESYSTRKEAMQREKQLKSSRGRSWLKEGILTSAVNPSADGS